jgi:tetratricopeptide (TPR) repeat protein
MGLFDKIKSVFSGTTSDVNPADKGQFVKSFTDKGEQVLIPRSEWRNRVLPDQLKNVWNDPEALYGAIVMAMQDGFFAEVIEAAKHLVEIDKITDRSYNVLGLAYLHTNALSEAEQTLEKGISVSDYKAVMTTNLAKVYVAQGEEQKAMQTLWSAIQLDPNQDNGLDWFTVLEFEKGGEPARLASYKKVAALPNSWRAKLYIARHHLEQKQFDTRTANTGFASGGLTCKLGALCFYSSSVLVDSFVLRNPPERKARNRYAVIIKIRHGIEDT